MRHSTLISHPYGNLMVNGLWVIVKFFTYSTDFLKSNLIKKKYVEACIVQGMETEKNDRCYTQDYRLTGKIKHQTIIII